VSVCSIPGCGEPQDARGWCRSHYKRWRRWGTPLGARLTYAEAFAARVDRRGPDECWPWMGKKQNRGYGVCCSGRELAHRFAYILAHGAIPAGLEIDHTCHNYSGCPGGQCAHRLCCNPAHLEAVEPLTNRLRSHLHAASKTHCLHGHPFDELNTHVFITSDGRRYRRCRQCAREQVRQPQRSRRVVPLKPCGTEAAYVRHLRHGEEPCSDCRIAHAAYARAKRRAA